MTGKLPGGIHENNIKLTALGQIVPFKVQDIGLNRHTPLWCVKLFQIKLCFGLCQSIEVYLEEGGQYKLYKRRL